MAATDASSQSRSAEPEIEAAGSDPDSPDSLDFTWLGAHVPGNDGEQVPDPAAAVRPDEDDALRASLTDPPEEKTTSQDMPARTAPSTAAHAEDGPSKSMRRLPLLGELVDSAPDTMQLHTVDAYYLFAGHPSDPVAASFPIPGGKRFAYIARSLWSLSEHDNPYVDWILVRVSYELAEIRAQMRRAIATREESIEALRRNGLVLSVMRSRDPMTMQLGFLSPYGYAMAELIRQFDYHVRMTRTLVFKDLMSDEQGKAEIYPMRRRIRTLFRDTIHWHRHLTSASLRGLRRSDFLPGADARASERVRAAVQLFGEVPRIVFTGAKAPRHTRRRVKVTGADLKALEEAPLSPVEPHSQPDSGCVSEPARS